jgi:hypothetical protein
MEFAYAQAYLTDDTRGCVCVCVFPVIVLVHVWTVPSEIDHYAALHFSSPS